MNQFLEWISRIFQSWKFWIIVAPWEIGVRVRFGKIAASLPSGPHLRIPILDQVFLVNTRLRVSSTPPVSLQGANGKVRVRCAAIGHKVNDPVRAMLAYSCVETAIIALASAEVAAFTSQEDCEMRLREVLGPNGISIEFVRFLEEVEVKAFRLIQGQPSAYLGGPVGPAVLPVQSF